MVKKGIISFGMLLVTSVFSYLILQTPTNNNQKVLSEQVVNTSNCGAYIFEPAPYELRHGDIDVKANIIPVYTDADTSTALDLTYIMLRGKNTSATDIVLKEVPKPSSGWSSQVTIRWNSTNVANGLINLYAVLNYGSGQKICQTEFVPITIDNETPSSESNTTQNLELKIGTLPTQWEGPTYYSLPISAFAKLYDKNTNTVIKNVTDQTIFEWSSTVGQIQPNFGKAVTFKSGPVADQGKITIDAQHEGMTAYRSIDIKVFSTNSTSDSSGSSSTDAVEDDSTAGETETTPTSTTGTSNEDTSKEVWDDYWFSEPPEVDDDSDVEEETGDSTTLKDPVKDRQRIIKCVYLTLGEEEYQNLSEAESRLNSDQFERVQSCFSVNNFIVPATVAPIDPNNVKEIKEVKEVKINDITNVDKIVNNEKTVVLQLSGEASPNKTVLIYVFSDPLVLSTKTDSSGRWVYTLEEPLEPGEHEAYVLVESDSDDGTYVRSGAFTFAVAGASTSPNNPNGYSLTLVEENYQTLTFYIMGAALLILLATLFVTRVIWSKPMKSSDNSNSDSKNISSNTDG